VTIVLVRPARVGNVAAACRAMKNMGLSELRLVAPPADLWSANARPLAYGAFDVLEAARPFDTLRGAVADASFVAATSGRAALASVGPRDLARQLAARTRGGRAAIVFGPERTGLTTQELRLCHLTVRIPTDAAQPSLNLAQAVLIVAYEIFQNAAPSHSQPAPAASVEALEAALDDLRAALLAVGYLDRVNPERILSELRGLLARAGPSGRELKLLRGVARQVGWAGRIAAGQRRGR